MGLLSETNSLRFRSLREGDNIEPIRWVTIVLRLKKTGKKDCGFPNENPRRREETMSSPRQRKKERGDCG